MTFVLVSTRIALNLLQLARCLFFYTLILSDDLVDCAVFNCTTVDVDNCTNPYGCNFTEYDYVGAFRAYFNEDYYEVGELAVTQVPGPTTTKKHKSKNNPTSAATTTEEETEAPAAGDDEIGNLETGGEEDEEVEKTSAAGEGARTSKVALVFLVICALANN